MKTHQITIFLFMFAFFISSSLQSRGVLQSDTRARSPLYVGIRPHRSCAEPSPDIIAAELEAHILAQVFKEKELCEKIYGKSARQRIAEQKNDALKQSKTKKPEKKPERDPHEDPDDPDDPDDEEELFLTDKQRKEVLLL